MKALLALALCAAVPAGAQRVIFDLDQGYGEGIGQLYILLYNAESGIGLTSTAEGFDKRAAQAAWRIESASGRLGYAGFGYLHSAASSTVPFPDLTPYTHLSLRYNNVRPAAGAERVAFRFELYESETETAPDGDRRRQVWVYETDGVLATPTGWTELLMPLVQADNVGSDGFAVVPGGFQGDGVLDLDKIGYWSLLLLVEGEPVGTVIEGTTLFDYLTAVARPVVAGPEPPASFPTELRRSRPNPFSSSATLTFTLAAPASASLRVYDVLGREVAVLVDEQPLAAGEHEATLDGRGLAPGTYVCVLEVGGERFTQVVTRGR